MNTNTNFIQQLGSADFESWLLVQQAYRDYAFGEEILEAGFNTNSGYVYIALENGVQIASCFGQDVDYIVFDFETGEEYFLDSYDEAIEKLNNI
jgi:hypothetical protein